MKMKRTIACLLIAALMLGMLAGCGSTQPTAETTQAAQTDGIQATQAQETAVNKDAVFVGGWPYSVPPTGHYNMFVSNAIELKYFRELHQLPLATYTAADDSYQPMLAESWQINEDSTLFTVNLRDDVTWLNGDKFTAKDVWTTFMIYKLVGNPVWSYINSVEETSDTVVTFEISNPTSLLLRYVLRKPIVDFATYGEYAQKVQDLVDAGLGTDSAEWQELVNEFNMYRPDFVNATGPYYLDPASVTESCIELKKNENSFLADTVNFSKIMVYNGDVPELTPLVLNGEVDFLTHQFPAATMDTFESMGYQILQVAGMDGIALYFNEAVKPFDSKEVRQAIAYIVDRAKVGELALPGVSRGTKYVSGLGDTMTESWVDTSKLIDYTVDYDKAEQLLTQAGLTKKDGQWYKADGSQFTIALQCPTSWSDGSTAATEIANQLTNFGIKTSVDGIDSTLRQSNINEGAYEVAISFFGTAQAHPMFAFETPFLISNVNCSKGLSYPMVQETECCGTVDLNAEITASTAGWDTEAQKEAVGKIVYTLNETVPILPLYTKYSKYVTSDGLRTDWGDNDALYQNSAGDDSFVVMKILSGELKSLN